jgi:hypothetical protein
MDGDLGLSFDVMRRLLDFILGLRYRTLTTNVDASYSEIITSTYLGFAVNGYF